MVQAFLGMILLLAILWITGVFEDEQVAQPPPTTVVVREQDNNERSSNNQREDDESAEQNEPVDTSIQQQGPEEQEQEPACETVNCEPRRESGKCQQLSSGGDWDWNGCDEDFSAGEAVEAWRITDANGNLVFDGNIHNNGQPRYWPSIDFSGTCYDCVVNPWPAEVSEH